MQPTNYGALQPLPDFGGGMPLGQLLMQNRADRQALEINDFKLQQARAAQARQQEFQRDVMTVLGGNPGIVAGDKQERWVDPATQRLINMKGPDGITRLLLKYPEFKDSLKAAWDQQDEAVKRADLDQASKVWSALNAGKTDVAIGILENRIKADAANGTPDQDDIDALDLLKSGDPKKVDAVKGALGLHMAAVVPDKFAAVTGALTEQGGDFTLGPGAKRYDRSGNVIAEAPFAPEYRNVGQGDTLVVVGGGDPASGGANNNPGNIRDSEWARKQPGYQGVDSRGFAIFAPGAGVQAQTSLLRNYVSNGHDTPLKIASRWAPAGDGANDPSAYAKYIADDLGIGVNDKVTPAQIGKIAQTITRVEGNGSGGGSRVIAQGAPKQNYAPLSATEKQQLGLPTNIAYQRSPTGEVSAISGQDTRTQQAQAVPPTAQASIIENHGTIREIVRAIALLGGDENLGIPAAPNAYAGALGMSNSVTPDWILQRTDKKGVPVRAAIGKIGGKIIHDISGAAVTLSEAPRFQPYVPQISDSPDTAKEKLRQLLQLARGTQGDLTQAYGPDNGYRGVKLTPISGDPVRVSSIQQAQKLAPGTLYIRPDGKVMRR